MTGWCIFITKETRNKIGLIRRRVLTSGTVITLYADQLKKHGLRHGLVRKCKGGSYLQPDVKHDAYAGEKRIFSRTIIKISIMQEKKSSNTVTQILSMEHL